MALALPAAAQRAAIQPDSAHAQIRTVLRGFYLNMESRNWDALAAYVRWIHAASWRPLIH